MFLVTVVSVFLAQCLEGSLAEWFMSSNKAVNDKRRALSGLLNEFLMSEGVYRMRYICEL